MCWKLFVGFRFTNGCSEIFEYKFKVKISGILGRIPSTESISQGSVLGNTWFILAMNNLAKRIPRINCSVDMTAIWIVYSEVQKGTNIHQRAIDCVYTWFVTYGFKTQKNKLLD